MPASEQNSGPPPGEIQPVYRTPPRSAEDSFDRKLLEEIIQQSSQESNSDALSAVLPVVEKLRGHPFSLDPVTVELVQAMLVGQFTAWNISPAEWIDVSRRIAATLFDDPLAHEQLESFWTRLQAES